MSEETPKVEPVPVKFVGPKTPSVFGPPLTKEEMIEEVQLHKTEGDQGSGTTPKFSLNNLLRFGQNKD